MLDFSKLKTPPRHGDVLVAPDAASWSTAANSNHRALGQVERPLAGATLAHWRRRTREKLAGTTDALVIVLGHQPDFIHPGVWAKHVAASRMAAAVDGVALNLVVDSDVAKSGTLSVLRVDHGQVEPLHVSFAEFSAGTSFERIPPRTGEQLARFTGQVVDAMGAEFERSQMPAFLEALATAPAPGDWVDQIVAARRAIEGRFGVRLRERRISASWCNPIVVDILQNARAFADSYNRALAAYRRTHRVRGGQRPMPDLLAEEQRIEVPLWVYHPQGPRRRLFLVGSGANRSLLAGDEEFTTLDLERTRTCDDLEAAFARLAGWELRPRALTLTIWARLLLADLFVHGIGGAKYDRISDAIIVDYYGVEPPAMACVSATLHLGLGVERTTDDDVRHRRQALRDATWNPQRHIPTAAQTEDLLNQREQVVRRSNELRDRTPHDRSARRAGFRRIRALNEALLAECPELLPARRKELERVLVAREQTRIAEGRDYFFGLYDDARIKCLLSAMPDVREFAVSPR